jgi:hypothetical protein
MKTPELVSKPVAQPFRAAWCRAKALRYVGLKPVLVATVGILSMLGLTAQSQSEKPADKSKSTTVSVLKVSGMSCSACAARVEKEAKKIAGAMMNMGGNMMGMSAVGIIWMLLAAAVVIVRLRVCCLCRALYDQTPLLPTGTNRGHASRCRYPGGPPLSAAHVFDRPSSSNPLTLSTTWSVRLSTGVTRGVRAMASCSSCQLRSSCESEI